LLLLTALLTVLADLAIAIAVGTVLGLALKLARGEIEPPSWHTLFRWGGDKRQ
jgi:SulP family sulfate permease